MYCQRCRSSRLAAPVPEFRSFFFLSSATLGALRIWWGLSFEHNNFFWGWNLISHTSKFEQNDLKRGANTRSQTQFFLCSNAFKLLQNYLNFQEIGCRKFALMRWSFSASFSQCLTEFSPDVDFVNLEPALACLKGRFGNWACFCIPTMGYKVTPSKKGGL